jgi:VanZ family protein
MKYIALLFLVFIILVIVAADMGAMPASIHALYDFPNGDRLGHFILYGILSFLLNLTFLRSLPTRPRKRVALTVSLLLALAIGLEEFSQMFFPERTADWVDLTCSYLGVAVGAWFAYRNKKK